MEYYLTMKRNEVWIHAIAWMNIENIMLIERSHSRKMTVYSSIYAKYAEKGNCRDRKQTRDFFWLMQGQCKRKMRGNW